MSTKHILGILVLASALAIGLAILGPGGSQVLMSPGIAAGATNVSSTVLVTSSTPTLSVTISSTATTPATITLTANTTTPIAVQAQVVNLSGCTDTLSGTENILLYRLGKTSSSCLSGGTDYRDCYATTTFSATSSCSSLTTINTTTTFNVQYYADATDASTSYNGQQNWVATVTVTSSAGVGGLGESTHSTSSDVMSTLTAINVTTSSINYGSIAAGSVSASNQLATTTNAGNGTTTIALSTSQTLTSGSNIIATGSQYYASSSFTCCSSATATALTGSPVIVNGFLLLTPTTSTAANVGTTTYWGLQVPSGTAAGTYNGVNQFTVYWHS